MQENTNNNHNQEWLSVLQKPLLQKYASNFLKNSQKELKARSAQIKEKEKNLININNKINQAFLAEKALALRIHAHKKKEENKKQNKEEELIRSVFFTEEKEI